MQLKKIWNDYVNNYKKSVIKEGVEERIKAFIKKQNVSEHVVQFLENILENPQLLAKIRLVEDSGFINGTHVICHDCIFVDDFEDVLNLKYNIISKTNVMQGIEAYKDRLDFLHLNLITN